MAKTVLVADDDKDITDAIKRILERKRYSISVVYDGFSAKDMLEKIIYDVVLLDCSMPGLTGVELIRFIREKNPATKIVIFTGFSVDDKLVKDLGADSFLRKPISAEMIEKEIES
jgi:DNA-binding response OmpR family regulator